MYRYHINYLESYRFRTSQEVYGEKLKFRGKSLQRISTLLYKKSKSKSKRYGRFDRKLNN